MTRETVRQPIQLNMRIENPPRFFLIMAMLALGSILVRNLWISDDSFITMRVADNFLHGYGLVWNVGERVQVFTHPLWLFLLIPLAHFIHDPYYVLYIPSFLISLGAIYLFLQRFAVRPRAIVLTAIALGGSMAFIDYSSSGLENPLTHLLLVLYLIVLFREDERPFRKLLHLSLLTALGALTRFDAMLLLLPGLVWQFWLCRDEWRKALGVTLAGLLPLILWELFALFYYGFPFPNTYYVKARTGLDTYYLLKQGAAYFANSIRWDPFTLGAVLLGLITVGFQGNAKRLSVAMGIALYVLYILWIGGDFMSGRFFSAIFLMGLTLLLTFDIERTFGQVPPRVYYLSLILLLLLGLTAERPPVLMREGQPGPPNDQYGIANEKYYYFGATGWTNYFKYKSYYGTVGDGKQARVAGLSPIEYNQIGFFGYYVGPKIYIIDDYALSDPLRAHLPVLGPSRVGHYERPMPIGYRETIASGFKNNFIANPYLNLYYEKLTLLIHGDLLAPGRLVEIIRFNLGYYNDLIRGYEDFPDPQ